MNMIVSPNTKADIAWGTILEENDVLPLGKRVVDEDERVFSARP